MTKPGIRETFRLHMGWLHSWVGFIAGLVLACIFLTGTLTVFDQEITQWMQPEVPLSPSHHITPEALQTAADAVLHNQKQGRAVFINLPSARDPVLRVLHYNGTAFTGPAYDPATGILLKGRDTEGGQFFYNFHYTLHSGRIVGGILTGLAGLFLLVALLSGLIIHLRSIWPDMVLFRPFGPRPRAWLDAHLLTGVLFLPFLLIITYTGTIIQPYSLFAQKPRPAAATPARHIETTALPPLFPLIEETKKRLNTQECGFILFTPEDIRISRSDYSSLFLTRDQAIFDRNDGHFLRIITHDSTADRPFQLARGLHHARFSISVLSWLYFLSGLSCTILIISGLVLFLIKRRRISDHMTVYKLAEGFCILTVVGLPISALAFLWANRLIPVSFPGRAEAEVSVFFATWTLSATQAICFSLARRPFAAWTMQLITLAALGVGLPIADALMVPHPTPRNVALSCTVDIWCLITATAAAVAAMRLIKKTS